MMDTMKLFQKNIQTHSQKKFEEFDKNKMIDELKEKLDNNEKENVILKKNIDTKEIAYKDRIKTLENKILTTDKHDIVLLQNQNKEYENQITSLNNQMKNLSTKFENEKYRSNHIIGELLLVRDQLIHEINSIDLVKIELLKNKQPKVKEKQSEGQKVEFLLKFVEPSAPSHSKSQQEVVKKEEKSLSKLQERHKSTKPAALNMNISSLDRDESVPKLVDKYKIIRNSRTEFTDKGNDNNNNK